MLKKLMSSNKDVPQTYKPVVEAPEVVELYSRLTLHHQTALLRLISRNLEIEINGESTMGYEMDFEVVGAMIKATEATD
tara:strand:+ start:1062 stop:1298 length:237 start_codon:yes stop_codon:yes gene_type:complete